MMRKMLTGLALIAGCATALAVPAQAETYGNWHGNTAFNNRESARHESLRQTDLSVRLERARKECGPITNAHLRTGCLDSLDVTEDEFSRDRNEGLTGGGSGAMKAPGVPVYKPELNGAGR